MSDKLYFLRSSGHFVNYVTTGTGAPAGLHSDSTSATPGEYVERNIVLAPKESGEGDSAVVYVEREE
jgi:hypothetical protein